MPVQLQVSIENNISGMIRRIQKKLDNLPGEAYRVFYDKTPVRTGWAKQNTKLVNRNTIVANYNYAEVLDRGRHRTGRGMRGSTQAPRGMSAPTIEYLRGRFSQIIRSRGVR